MINPTEFTSFEQTRMVTTRLLLLSFDYLQSVYSNSSLNFLVCGVCQSTATINNLLRQSQSINTRTSICSKSVLFTTPFTHLCFCRGGSDVFRESDKGYFSPTLSCYFPGSFVWLRDLGRSVLRGMRGTFEPKHLNV